MVAQATSVIHLWRAVFVRGVVRRRVASYNGRASNEGTLAVELENMSLCRWDVMQRTHQSFRPVSNGKSRGAAGVLHSVCVGDVASRAGRKEGGNESATLEGTYPT